MLVADSSACLYYTLTNHNHSRNNRSTTDLGMINYTYKPEMLKNRFWSKMPLLPTVPVL